MVRPRLTAPFSPCVMRLSYCQMYYPKPASVHKSSPEIRKNKKKFHQSYLVGDLKSMWFGKISVVLTIKEYRQQAVCSISILISFWRTSRNNSAGTRADSEKMSTLEVWATIHKILCPPLMGLDKWLRHDQLYDEDEEEEETVAEKSLPLRMLQHYMGLH